MVHPRIGDILISASGTIGRAIEFDGQDAYFQDSNIVWLEHDDSKVLNRFLYYCYQIADWKVSKGGTIARLYNDNSKKTLIPLPLSPSSAALWRSSTASTRCPTQFLRACHEKLPCAASNMNTIATRCSASPNRRPRPKGRPPQLRAKRAQRRESGRVFIARDF